MPCRLIMALQAAGERMPWWMTAMKKPTSRRNGRWQTVTAAVFEPVSGLGLMRVRDLSGIFTSPDHVGHDERANHFADNEHNPVGQMQCVAVGNRESCRREARSCPALICLARSAPYRKTVVSIGAATADESRIRVDRRYFGEGEQQPVEKFRDRESQARGKGNHEARRNKIDQPIAKRHTDQHPSVSFRAARNRERQRPAR